MLGAMVKAMSTEGKAVEVVKQATVREQAIREHTAKRMGIVRCNNFRCLGVMGSDGIWRDAHQRPLEVVEVVTEF